MSDRLDPYWNLAVEECLLDRAATASPMLFLWQSRPAVIIGKNQNPWRECNVPWMTEHDVMLARRVSGGGAVYHDEGNLNYAFFMPRESYRADAVYDQLAAVLSGFDLRVERMNRTSLAVDGRKVSGNAFCFRRNAALHHGTLLVTANLAHVRASLESPPWTFVTRATESIRASVANLSDWRATLTVEQVMAAFIGVCGDGTEADPPERWLRPEEVRSRVAVLMSREWQYDHTPPFDVRVPVMCEGVAHELVLTVEKGIVVRASSNDADRQREWKGIWEGNPFDGDALTRFLAVR